MIERRTYEERLEDALYEQEQEAKKRRGQGAFKDTLEYNLGISPAELGEQIVSGCLNEGEGTGRRILGTILHRSQNQKRK